MSEELPNVSGATNWHALFIRHQHEKPVALALTHKNYEVYLPQYCSVRRWRDRAKQLWLPLFPGYVFLHGGLERQLQILTTPGVIRIVRLGERPAIVPQAQIDAVKKILASRAAVETHPYLVCGDRVKVKYGPLAGLEGILTRKKNLAYLVISMEMLGRSAAVEIKMENVERIESLRATSPAHPAVALA